jgi:DNA polymerase-1
VGATNYRRAITGPPLQQYPQEHPKPFWKKLAEVRSVLRPDPGFCFIEADYRQIELHGAARLSGDQVFLEDLKTGDYHTRIVREVFHCDDPEDSVVFHHTRRIGKVFNFAVLYRVEENTLSKAMNEGIAFGTNSKPVTPREAGRLIRQWYTRNRTYWLWQEELLKEVKRKGRLVNPFGEVRRFPLYDPLLDKQIVNFPVSSTCGAHSEISLIELEPIIRRNFGGSILFDTHDSLLFHVPTKKRRSAARIIREIMEEPKIPGWDPLEIEFKMSEVNWRQMKVWDERA